jgi:RNA polymerase sigma-70 factor (ECF subfamily)
MCPNLSDNQLLHLLKKGDEAAFSTLYQRYWKQLFFMAHKRLLSAEDSREIVQNIFFNLWQKRERLDIQDLSLYLSGMLRFAVYRFLANKKRKQEVLNGFMQVQSGKVADIFDIDNKQLLEILTQFTNTLPERCRMVFIHHKLLDRPLQDIAAELGVSTRTAEGYIAKVMKSLRRFRHELVLKSVLW